MAYLLHIPGESSRALRWTVHDSRSRYGHGVLLFRSARAPGGEILDGATFRALRDGLGARLETDRPDRARAALGLMQDESLGDVHACSSGFDQ